MSLVSHNHNNLNNHNNQIKHIPYVEYKLLNSQYTAFVVINNREIVLNCSSIENFVFVNYGFILKKMVIKNNCSINSNTDLNSILNPAANNYSKFNFGHHNARKKNISDRFNYEILEINNRKRKYCSNYISNPSLSFNKNLYSLLKMEMMENLTHIEITNSEIRNIKGISNMTFIHTLILKKNMLTDDILCEINKFNHLKYLDISDNYLSDFSELNKTNKLNKLEVFIIDNNLIVTLKKINDANLSNLKHLSVNSNYMCASDSVIIDKMNNLKILEIVNNEFNDQQKDNIEHMFIVSKFKILLLM